MRQIAYYNRGEKNRMMISERIKDIKVQTENGPEPLSKFVSFLVGKYGEIPDDKLINEEFLKISKRNTVVILVLLNLSSGLRKNWENFHIKYQRNKDGTIDFDKIDNRDGAKKFFDYIVKDFPALYGSYMTDFYKGKTEYIDPDSNEFMKHITKNRKDPNRIVYENQCANLLKKEIETVTLGDKKKKVILLAYGEKVFDTLKFNGFCDEYLVFKCTHVSPQATKAFKEKYIKEYKQIISEIY